jgi:pimeloyl-ACP methyl ester carboxylesterase
MTNRGRLALVFVTLAVVGFTLHAQPAQPETSAPVGCPSSGQGVQQAQFVRIGGIEQWITTTGESCANPVLLFLHGGPGNTLSPYAADLFGSWEKDFTLAQWDQRGAGRTYGRNPPSAESTLTLERMTEDGLAVAEYLIRQLGQSKIILVGGSWGSILGIHMIKAKPALFHAYVGFSQFVSHRENQPASYTRVMAAARAAGDEKTLAALDALGSPPWKNPRSYGILRRATRAYEAATTDPAPTSWWVRAPEYDTPSDRDTYLEGEDFSYLQFVGLEGNGMLSEVDLPALGRTFAVPVFLAQGAEDLVTVPDVAKRFFDGIAAPEERFVLVPRAGHDPNEPLLDAVFELVSRYARR